MTDFPPGFLPPGTSAVMVFTDKTPNTIILRRIVVRSFELVRCTDLEPEETSDFLDLVILIARKMLSVWNHLQAYHAEERKFRGWPLANIAQVSPRNPAAW